MGTALLRRLDRRTEVVGVCRRLPEPTGAWADVRWVQQDVAGPDAVQRLTDAFAGVDAVVHTAWLIQPARGPRRDGAGELTGSENVVRAALAEGVPHVVHLSSVGAYATHPVDDARVDESWPRTGSPPRSTPGEKAAVESHWTWWNATNPNSSSRGSVPALVFQRDAGSEIARYFLGPFVPTRLLRRVPLPVLPLPEGLRFQVVHADDLADALARILERARVVRSTWRRARPAGAGTWRCR